ncbi:MAG: helix-turn-helix domain-containing protein, partial [Chthoniobacterales bacterium]
MEADPKQTGEALRELRRSRGMSLRALARKSGCSPSFLSQVEQG